MPLWPPMNSVECGKPVSGSRVHSRAPLPRNSRSGSETAGGAAPTTCRSDLQQMLLDKLHLPLCPRQHAACQPAERRLGFWNVGSEQLGGDEVILHLVILHLNFFVSFACLERVHTLQVIRPITTKTADSHLMLEHLLIGPMYALLQGPLLFGKHCCDKH